VRLPPRRTRRPALSPHQQNRLAADLLVAVAACFALYQLLGPRLPVVEPRLTWRAHGYAIEEIAPSPNTREVATTSPDGGIVLWQRSTGEQVVRLNGHVDLASSLAFSPDGRWLVSAAMDGSILIWDRARRRRVKKLRDSNSSTNSPCVAFSRDGNWLAAADGKEILFWKSGVWMTPVHLRGHREEVRDMVLSPDSSLIASADATGTVRLWSLPGGSELGSVQGHPSTFRSMAFSPDGRLLATGGDDGTIRLWSIGTRGPAATLRVPSTSALSSASPTDVTFSPDGRLIVAAASTQTGLHVWDVARRRKLPALRGADAPFAFSPDGRYLVCRQPPSLFGLRDNELQLWRLPDLRPAGRLTGASDPASTLRFTGDGRQVIAAVGYGKAAIWDLPR
jgi:WD40 repeat protein